MRSLAPAPEDGFEDTELVGEQALVAARTVVPVAPVDAALVAAEDLGFGEPSAQALQHPIAFANHATMVERHDKVPRLRMGASPVLVVTERVALDDIGEVVVRDVPKITRQTELSVREADFL